MTNFRVTGDCPAAAFDLLLPLTVAEEKGWVDRSRLLDISGRSRTRQMELAAQYRLTDYPSPAGGCLLTNEGFARRLQRLLALDPTAEADDMHILRYGRHFYLQENNLLVIGRNQKENKALADLARPRITPAGKNPSRPLAVLRPRVMAEAEVMKPLHW